MAMFAPPRKPGASRHLLPAARRGERAPLRPAKRLFDAHIFSLSFLTNSDSLQGQILEPMMDLSAVDVERYGVGGFGDERLEKRGPCVTPRLSRALVRACARLPAAGGAPRLVSGAFCAMRP